MHFLISFQSFVVTFNLRAFLIQNFNPVMDPFNKAGSPQMHRRRVNLKLSTSSNEF